MKKILVLALAIVMALSVVALVACGTEETVEGSYAYANAWTPEQQYGCKVKVTVKGGVITAIEVTPDTDTYYNLSSGWTDKSKWENGGEDMINSFIGMKVEDVNKIKVACDAETDTAARTVKGQPKAGGISDAPAALKVVAGATQSSGRLILAVQDALSKLGK